MVRQLGCGMGCASNTAEPATTRGASWYPSEERGVIPLRVSRQRRFSSMRQMLKLWNDDGGFSANTVEWLFMITILVIGLITGWVAVRQALLSELIETAQAILALNQSFSFSGQSNCESSTAGSSGSDTTNTISDVSVSASTANINQNPCD